MTYGDLKAVDGVSLEVGEGEFVGILGANGAGKTTTLETIEGLRRPDSGSVTVPGQPVWPRNSALLPRIGVELQASSFFERLTTREQIHTFASLYGVGPAAADEWMGRVGLDDKADTRVEQLSGGQAQRLSILRAGPRPRGGLPRRAHGRPRPAGAATCGTCCPGSTTPVAPWC
jgi:ABC-2 type transport system ATP-binding protein